MAAVAYKIDFIDAFLQLVRAKYNSRNIYFFYSINRFADTFYQIQFQVITVLEICIKCVITAHEKFQRVLGPLKSKIVFGGFPRLAKRQNVILSCILVEGQDTTTGS